MSIQTCSFLKKKILMNFSIKILIKKNKNNKIKKKIKSKLIKMKNKKIKRMMKKLMKYKQLGKHFNFQSTS